jgi:hypothetical protein
MSSKSQCGATFQTSDRTLTCGRDDRHITHTDTATGDRFTRTPGGAVIKPAKN